ncbi:DUF3097 domain-containing protein [Corynebacterium kutscheri]|uniref:Protein of uncharacterized function (DUF3097) n=1 Tax=Corynebacterium kutscheri TaxID=35755 RepID=A0AB38VTD1_9CORY|nr:DUF3097 domain-containing protein [Corynebacterium kutscheri]VEH08520.1 Protein of uncharacterised function (DUF3097) [Corynebacterium kutscheri]
MSSSDPYGHDILSGHPRNKKPDYPLVPARPGEIVEVLADGFVGAIVGFERTYDGDFIRLEDRYHTQRLFKMRPGAFMIDGQRITLTRFVEKQAPRRSNSGSKQVAGVQAKVAAPSRIWVEGVHDAALVEKIWGHDLRVEGVVVEYLEGLDNLEERLIEFQPNSKRRIGVLADHLVTGSKEMRLTQSVGPHVLVTGYPFIDIWAAVKPERVGLRAWPEIPYGEDWKTGICQRVGWSNPQEGWHRIYHAVQSFRDIDSSLIGAVERLVDFVTTPELNKEDLV